MMSKFWTTQPDTPLETRPAMTGGVAVPYGYAHSGHVATRVASVGRHAESEYAVQRACAALSDHYAPGASTTERSSSVRSIG